MTKAPVAFFGATPFRAYGDSTLTELDLRVLGVIARHDQMSLLKGGDGCWAGVDRIAARIVTAGSVGHANYNNVSSSIAKLVGRGYLKRDPHPKDRRRSTYRVIYDLDLDRGWFEGNVSPMGEINPESVSPGQGPNSRPNDQSVSPAKPERTTMPKRSTTQEKQERQRETIGSIDQNGSAKKPASPPAAPVDEKQAVHYLQMIDDGQLYPLGAEQAAKRILASDALPSDLRDRAQTYLDRAAAEKEGRRVFRP